VSVSSGWAPWLDIDNDSAFAELVCPDTKVPAWPTIRSTVIRLLVGDLHYDTAPLVELRSRPRIRRILGSAVRAGAHNIRHPPRESDVLLLASGAGLIPRNGGSFNRYVDYFADALGARAWTLESLFQDQWPTLRRANPRLNFRAPDRLVLAIAARCQVRRVHRAIADDLVELAASRARDLLGWQLDGHRVATLKSIAARSLATYPVQASLARRTLSRVRPRIALVEEACYGHMAVFNATARELGVTVAEFQHGLITRSHDAYNVSETLAQSPAYRQTQPAALLAYGRWWTNQFNAPVDDRVVVGNPHRSEALQRWHGASRRSAIVVLGDGVETDAYVAFCRELASRVKDSHEVVFRPHPQERERLTNPPAGVKFDYVPDFYDAITTADAVIGEASTALFEAVGLVPRIFVRDTGKSRFYLGEHLFERFTDAADLAVHIASPDRGAVNSGLATEVWAGGWRNRFLAYVANHV
jgi:hypothetical protein